MVLDLNSRHENPIGPRPATANIINIELRQNTNIFYVIGISRKTINRAREFAFRRTMHAVIRLAPSPIAVTTGVAVFLRSRTLAGLGE